MDIRKRFATNKRAEESGLWFDIGDGARVKVARDTSSRYREKLRDLSRPYKGALAAQALSDEASHKILAKAAAGTLLVDWDGMTSDGKELPFSVEAAEQMMVDYRDFYLMIVEGFARDVAAFREEHEAAEQKN